jgi:DNA-binding transcriptional LysR family regulator
MAGCTPGRDGRELKVRVDGQLVFNGTAQILSAALAGLGLAYVPESMVQADLANHRLSQVLENWCLAYSGYYLFYPSRRQSTPGYLASPRGNKASRAVQKAR